MINKFTGQEWFSINESDLNWATTGWSKGLYPDPDPDLIIKDAVDKWMNKMRERGVKLTDKNKPEVIKGILTYLNGLRGKRYTEKDIIDHLPVSENLGTGVGRAGGPILTVGKSGKHYMPGDLKKEGSKKIRRKKKKGGSYGMGDSHAGNGDD